MEIKENLKDTNIWLRGLFMLLFAAIFGLAAWILTAVVLLQFLIRLISGELNSRLQGFGEQLTVYLYELMRYLIFAQEQRPFPFSDWPTAAVKARAAPKKRAVRKKSTRKAKTAAESEKKPQVDKADVDDDPNETGVV